MTRLKELLYQETLTLIKLLKLGIKQFEIMVLWRDVVCILEIYNIIILLNRY